MQKKHLRVTAYLPMEEGERPELYYRLRAEAFRQRKSISQLAGELIARGIEQTKAEGA